MLASDRRVEAAERPRRPNMMSFLESKKAPTAHVGEHSRRFHPPGPQGKQELGGRMCPQWALRSEGVWQRGKQPRAHAGGFV